MKYNYTLTIELKSGKTKTYNPEVVFSHHEDDYGNGFYMVVENCGFDFLNLFDVRYDTRLDPKKLNEYFPIFARDKWSGENGSAKLIHIEEVQNTLSVGKIVKMENSQGEDFTVKIVNLFEADGISYAEVEPVGFNGFTREVPIEKIREV